MFAKKKKKKNDVAFSRSVICGGKNKVSADRTSSFELNMENLRRMLSEIMFLSQRKMTESELM